MNKHTPGPWRVEQYADCLTSLTYYVITTADCDGTLESEEADANELLIQAAPAMLEALERIEALYSNLRHGGPAPEDLQSLSDALEEACDIARDAIELAVNGAQP